MKTYTGIIYIKDSNEYNLPKGKVKMVCNGFWIGEKGKHISSYVFADGTNPEMAFTRDRKNIFYLEAIN